MAISINSVFEVQTGGNDTNGGGFVTGAAGTDYSLVAAKRTATGANDSTTDAVAVGTGVITSATAVFTSAIVGNIIYLQGGTGTLAAGWYQVITFTSATSITVDRNVAAGTGITMNIGGALASPGMSGGVGLVAGNTVYVKAGTYSVTSASTNVSAGCLSLGTTQVIYEGYQTTRGDFGTPPLLQASGISTATLFTTGTNNGQIRNINVDGAGLTAIRGFSCGRGVLYICGASNCTNSGFSLVNVLGSRLFATGCSTAIAIISGTAGSLNSCVAYNNTISGFSLDGVTAISCIADSNSGAASDGFVLASAVTLRNCVSYGNGRDGVRVTSSVTTLIVNTISESNTGFGFLIAGGSLNSNLFHGATFSNTGGATSGTFALIIGAVVGTGSFFIDAPNQDFALNNTAGAGASARAVGFPGVLTLGGTGYLDIGALQHADPSGSSSALIRHPGMSGGTSA